MLSPMNLTAATEAAGLAVRCAQPDLERALARVARATAARPLMPVLGTVLLTAADGRLALAATDLELAVTAPVAAVVERAGAVAIPARLLADFVASLPAAPVDLTVDSSTRTLRVAGARARASIKGLDPDDFPAIPPPGGAPAARVEAGRLSDLIGRVAFSAGTDDSRPTLKGIHLQLDGARLTLAAADGYRLTEGSVALDIPAAPASAIVPARGLRELARLLADPAEVVELRLESNRIGFQVSGAAVLVRLIDGAFPDYRAVIPAAATTRTVVETAELLRATRRAAAFGRDGDGAARLTLAPAHLGGGTGRLMLAVDAAEVGDYAGELDAAVEGPAAEIAFNARYLAEALGAVPTERTALETTGPTQPGVLRPVGADGFVHVLMPMHIVRRGAAPGASA